MILALTDKSDRKTFLKVDGVTLQWTADLLFLTSCFTCRLQQVHVINKTSFYIPPYHLHRQTYPRLAITVPCDYCFAIRVFAPYTEMGP